MRILLTADPGLPVPPPLYGGIERIVADLCTALGAQGIAVGLLASSGSTAAAENVFEWPSGGGLRTALALREAADRHGADLIHSFSRLAFLGSLFPFRRPMLMSYQRLPTARNVTMASRVAGSKLRFSGCSNFIADLGRQAGGRWFSVPNFVDLSRFKFEQNVPADAPLLFLSRVERVKGAHRAIRIARAARRRLIIAGNRSIEGAEAQYFEQEVAPHIDGDAVSYVGAVDDRQKCALLRQAAALLVPIEWDEPFGIVFAEALACGTPVIAAPRGALPQIVEEGVHGFLPANDAAAVAAIDALPMVSREACRLRAEREFSSTVVVAKYVACYEQMLGDTRSQWP